MKTLRRLAARHWADALGLLSISTLLIDYFTRPGPLDFGARLIELVVIGPLCLLWVYSVFKTLDVDRSRARARERHEQEQAERIATALARRLR